MDLRAGTEVLNRRACLVIVWRNMLILFELGFGLFDVDSDGGSSISGECYL